LPTIHNITADQPVNQLAPDSFAPVEQVILNNLGRVFPAVTLVIIKDGDVLLHRAWGHLDPETQTRPAQTDSLFDLASITKIFTVTALLALLHARGVALDTPLVDLIPEFGADGPRPIDGGQDPHTKESLPVPDHLRGLTVDPGRVTLQHLLTHTAGLAAWRAVYQAAGPVPAPPDQPEPVSRAVRWANALRALCAYPFVGEPGAVVLYSDLGLLLLGEVVRRLSGRELDEAIRAQVLQPLQLPSPTFNPLRNDRCRQQIHPTEDDPNWRGRRVWGEVHDENACGVGGVAGHAGLFAAARDVAALGQAWLEEDERLAIPRDLMRLAKQEQAATGDLRRGLGWQIKPRVASFAGDLLSENTFGHTGFTGNSLWIDPERRLVIATLTNAVYYGREFNGFYEFRRAIHDTIVRAVR